MILVMVMAMIIIVVVINMTIIPGHSERFSSVLLSSQERPLFEKSSRNF